MADAHQDEAAEAKIGRLRDELRREHDSLVRSLADFENYRRRTEREQANAARGGKREVILPLLDVLDDFDRALTHLRNAPPEVTQGFEAIQRKLLSLLAAEGVRRFESVGDPFDPRSHEAIGTVASDEVPSGSVAEVLQDGYLWKQEVLRPARVRVAE